MTDASASASATAGAGSQKQWPATDAAKAKTNEPSKTQTASSLGQKSKGTSATGSKAANSESRDKVYAEKDEPLLYHQYP